MKIVFMGTPDFSVPCLRALNHAGHTISAVITQPDKAVGRKQVLMPPPVKQAALELGLQVYQPKTLRDGSALELLRGIAPDLIVVVAYGKILPPEILAVPKLGCINVHASLLPKYRGASPIQSAILAGETVTGVTTMLMDEGLDTGNILLQSSVMISEKDTAETVFEKLSLAGAELLIKTLDDAENVLPSPKKQSEADATYCTILSRESGKINCRNSAQAILNQVRGLNPWPSAYFLINQKKYKVHSAEIGPETHLPAGTLFIDKQGLFLSCSEGLSIRITEIQPEGKNRMPAAAFINGLKQTEGLKIDSESEATGC